ncbi:ABC transporter ATP-binding protein [Saccharopolyspora elongata]|uniref:Uncharacterized protein n=1 Tax=Saccharopolyspora elongata TaxID=2530387 RepID=A0A4R4XZM4_9PSEU|nr:ABC transporter ATP-binding protein [Saccharopolyspora elongata]TDD36800.1 hypothetical protein E1288_41380 [Saccharopolyspora elongata]
MWNGEGRVFRRPFPARNWSGTPGTTAFLSLPPTNVHVLTGRNGVGKSVLLNRMVAAVADVRATGVDSGQVVTNGATDRATLMNVVSVSFSAFDDLCRYHENRKRSNTPISDSGLPHPRIVAHQ